MELTQNNLQAHYFKSIFFRTNNPLLPLVWLSFTKRLLASDFLPSDFKEDASVILEWFDLNKYNNAYNLSEDEYEAIKYDLQQVKAQLVNYPAIKLAPKAYNF